MIYQFLKGGYDKVKTALGKTRSLFTHSLRNLLSGSIDEDVLEELEELFYEADMGVQTATELVDFVRTLYKKNPKIQADEIIEALEQELVSRMDYGPTTLHEGVEGQPTVIFMVGVNGNGKTTSIAKLTKQLMDQGQSVLLAAADTFRAAAVDQLQLWADRTGAQIVRGQPGSDPSAVVFDAVEAAKARGMDVVIVDTAGRLHTKKDLMEELSKMKRVCNKVLPGSPHETLMALDATTGQNAVDQAKVFHQSTPLTGLVLTKLDGTAKGGIVVALQKEIGIPIKFLGMGEGVDNFEAFNAKNFAKALFHKH